MSNDHAAMSEDDKPLGANGNSNGHVSNSRPNGRTVDEDSSQLSDASMTDDDEPLLVCARLRFVYFISALPCKY